MTEPDLREAFRTLAAPGTPPLGARDQILASVQRRRIRRRIVTGTGLVAAAALVATTVIAVHRGPHAPEPVTPRPAASTWTPIDPGPLSARHEQATVWTGKEMLVFGGSGARPCPPTAYCVPENQQKTTLVDGAAYDPGTDHWRRIADLPEQLVGLRATVVGDQVVVLGQPPRSRDDRGPMILDVTYLYDMARDRWHKADTAPTAWLDGGVPWEGNVLFARSSTEDTVAPEPVEFAPDTGTWSNLPPLPWTNVTDVTLVPAANGGLHALAAPSADGADSTYVHAVYDERHARWQELPPTTVRTGSAEWAWFQGRLVNPSQVHDPRLELTSAHQSGVWDDTSNAWVDAPQSDDPKALEDACRLSGTNSAGNAWLPTTSALVSIVPARVVPIPPCPEYGSVNSAVWTGTEMIAWGMTTGTLADYRNVGEGMRWTPPAPDSAASPAMHRGSLTSTQRKLASHAARESEKGIEGTFVGATAYLSRRGDPMDRGGPCDFPRPMLIVKVVWENDATFFHGGTPWPEDDGPRKAGILTVDPVSGKVCQSGARYRDVGGRPGETLLYGTWPDPAVS